MKSTPAPLSDVRWWPGSYAPDFKDVGKKPFAEEYFTINSEGICTRTVRKPAEDLAVWNNPANKIKTNYYFCKSAILFKKCDIRVLYYKIYL